MTIMVRLLAQSVPIPSEGQEAWPWIAAIACSACVFVFIKYNGSVEARVKRAETGQDKLLADEAAKVETIREATAITARGISLTEKAVEASVRNGEKLDAQSREILGLRSDNNALRAEIVELKREIPIIREEIQALSLLQRPDPPPRRRSGAGS